MANSEYEYTRRFEQSDSLLSNTWMVIRLDGHAFHKLSEKYEFEKPNDRRALRLMNQAAQAVMNDIPDICVGYGHSDEYSFVLHPSCQLYERRASKLVSTIVSKFTAYYIFAWRTVFTDKTLTPPLPSFDGRAVLYPTLQNLRDYLSWRQADCHINNLYNTTFWSLVQKGGLGRTKAEKELSGTVAAEKHEILFSRFNMNYNNEPEIFRKGTVIFHDYWVSSPLPSSFKKPPQPQRSHSEKTTTQQRSAPQLARSRTDAKTCLPLRSSTPLTTVAEQSDGRVRRATLPLASVAEQTNGQVWSPDSYGQPNDNANANANANTNTNINANINGNGNVNGNGNGNGNGTVNGNGTGNGNGNENHVRKHSSISRQKVKSRIATAHVDIIGKEFWDRRPWALKVGSERKKVLRHLFHWSYDEPDEPGIPELEPGVAL